MVPGVWRRFSGDPPAVAGLCIVVVFGLLALVAPWIVPGDPTRMGPVTFVPPGMPGHPLGTDDLGRDILGGILHGARVSLAVGLLAAGTSTTIGVIFGATAGFFGGRVDDVLMRITELFMVIPRFLLALVMVAYFGPSIVNVILVIGGLSWPMAARLTRGEFLTLREREFVQAARALGADSWRLVTRHLLPNALSPLVVSTSFQTASAILMEAGLSFLGLSDPSVMTWGRMLQNAQQFLRQAWWMGVFPGAVVFMVSLGLNLLGDGIEEASNPRSHRR